MTAAPDARDWISFEDDESTTWLFDASFLNSDWTCIFGRGCKGVLEEDATALGQGCCSHGAHFADKADRKAVEVNIKRLDATNWQRRKVTKQLGGPILKNDEGEWATRIVDGACCFHNDPDFPGGGGCALHRAALEAGERPLDWKPDVCWQLPLRLYTETDHQGAVTHTLREWKRRDWGDGGADFHWWCTESKDAFVGHQPVYRELQDEIIELVGDAPYQWLAAHLDARSARQILTHPAKRRRVAVRAATPAD